MSSAMSQSLTGLMRARLDGGAVLPRPDPDPRLRRRRQDRHGPDLGHGERRQGRWKANNFNYSFVGFVGRRRARGRRRRPDRGGQADGRAGRPDRDAGRCRSSSSADRDGRHDASSTCSDPPTLPTTGKADAGVTASPAVPTPGPVTAVADAVPHWPTMADASLTPPMGPGLASPPTSSSRRRGARSSDARSGRSGAAPSTRGSSARATSSSPCRASGPTVTRFLADAVAAGAAALLVTGRPAATWPPSATSRCVQVGDGLRALGAVAAAWRARFAPLVVGVTGSDRQDLDEGGDRERPRATGCGSSGARATRTTRSACR